MSKRIETSPIDSFPKFQNPFKNFQWWENDRPPDGEANLWEIKHELIDELANRLQQKNSIVELKPPITVPQKKAVKKEAKRTWQPDPSWHEPIILISTEGILQEAENILSETHKVFAVDFLPNLAYDCRHFWPDLQITLNAIANTAYNFELIDKNSGPGESVFDYTAWNFFTGIWGDFGVAIVLSYLCNLDDYLVVHRDMLSLALDSIVLDHNLVESILPLNGSISKLGAKKSEPIQLEIESFEGGNEYWINVNPLATFGQFPDWEDKFSTENLTPLLPIHSLKLSVVIENDPHHSQGAFETSLRFELVGSDEPPILVESELCNYSDETGLTPVQIVAFFRIFQASTVRHSLIRTEVQE